MWGTGAVVACALLIVIVSAERFVYQEKNIPAVPEGWIFLGKSPQGARLRLTFALRQRNLDAFDAHFWKIVTPGSPEYGNYMSISDITDMIGPSQESVSRVMSVLSASGARDVSVAQNRDFVSATLRIRDIEALLSTEFYSYAEPCTLRVRHLAWQKVYTLPPSLADDVAFVGGLVRVAAPKNCRTGKDAIRTKQPSDSDTTTSVIKKAYSVPEDSGARVEGNVQTVVSFLGQYFSTQDLHDFYRRYKIDSKGIEKVIGPNIENEPGLEAELDVQYLSGVADNVETWVWSCPGLHEKQEPFLDWLTNVSSTETIPNVFSISYGDFEPTLSSDYMERVNTELQKLAARGRSVLFASGDSGSGCTQSCDRFVSNFPASSPFVTAVGATSFSDGHLSHEVGVSFSSGGFSDTFARPSYQETAVSAFLAQSKIPTTYFNAKGRGFPDVAAVGVDFEIVNEGSVITVDGTSASCPSFAAIVSLLNNERLRKGMPAMGFLNTFLYQTSAKDPTAFHDITSGSTTAGCCQYGFACTAGWDPVTGLGTPNFTSIVRNALSETLFMP